MNKCLHSLCRSSCSARSTAQRSVRWIMERKEMSMKSATQRLVWVMTFLALSPNLVTACMGGEPEVSPPTPTYILVFWAHLAVLVLALFTHRRVVAFISDFAKTNPIQNWFSEKHAPIVTGATYGGLALALSLSLVITSPQVVWESPGCSELGHPSISFGASKTQK